jgi:hypothetical protein
MRDPEAQRRAARKHYATNKEAMKARAKFYTEKRRKELRLFLDTYKESRPCSDCGIQYPARVMEFDHCNGKKDFNVAEAVNRAYSMKRIEAEIEKCELVCANCHRLRTFNAE